MNNDMQVTQADVDTCVSESTSNDDQGTVMKREKFGGTAMDKKYVLKKDIVIPAGTVFETAPIITKRYSPDIVDTVFALSKDTVGRCEYSIDVNDPDIFTFFEEIKEDDINE